MMIGLMVALGLAQAPVPADPRADDVVAAYTSYCTDPNSDPAPARAALDGRPDVARKLDPATLSRFFGDAAAKIDEGWITHSLHDAWYVVAFAPSLRTCQVLIREADAPTLIARVRVAVQALVAARHGRATPVTDRRLEVEGVPATELAWTVDSADGSRVSILASVADRPFGAKQGLLTYSVLHAGAGK